MRASEQVQQLLSDTFHLLSQPITALVCSLELATLRDETADELRRSLHSALESATTVRERLLHAREMADACDPGDTGKPVPIHLVVREICEDLQPVFDSAGQTLSCSCPELQVFGNRQKIREGLFRLIGSLPPKQAPGGGVTIHGYASSPARTVSICIRAAPCVEDSPAGDHDWEIAKRIFVACRGALRVRLKAGEVVLVIRLRRFHAFIGTDKANCNLLAKN